MQRFHVKFHNYSAAGQKIGNGAGRAKKGQIDPRNIIKEYFDGDLRFPEAKTQAIYVKKARSGAR